MKEQNTLKRKVLTAALWCAVIAALVFSTLQYFGVSFDVKAGYAKTLPFQGRLTNPDGTNVDDGSYNMTFRIFTCSDCKIAPSWTEAHTGGNAVSVEDGVFNVLLGTIEDIDLDFNSGTYYLEVQVEDEILSPRRQIGGTGYSINTDNVTGVPGSLSDTNLDSFPKDERAVIDALNYLLGQVSSHGLWTDNGTALSPKAGASDNVNIDGGTLTVAGSITGPTNETINGIDINSGTISDATWNGNQISDNYIVALAGSSQGDVLYHNGTQWVQLSAGTSGRFLMTQGAGANPIWNAVSGTIANGTVDNSTLRWDNAGTTWTENTSILSNSDNLAIGTAINTSRNINAYTTTNDSYVVYAWNAGGGTNTYGALFNASGDVTGSNYAIRAQAAGSAANTSNAYGIYATAADADDSYGGYFAATDSDPDNNYGVYATVSNATANRAGQFSITTGGTGDDYGVYSSITTTGTGTNYGGYFLIGTGNTGADYGVRGYVVTGSSGSNFGGSFTIETGGAGVDYGVYALISNAGSTLSNYAGFFDISTGGTASDYGVYGRVSSGGNTGTNYGGYFEITTGGDGTDIGVMGHLSNSGDGTNYASSFRISTGGTGADYGVYGYIDNASSGNNVAGQFTINSAGDGDDIGVYGTLASPGNGDNYASRFYLATGGTGSDYAVWAQLHDGGDGTDYVGYFDPGTGGDIEYGVYIDDGADTDELYVNGTANIFGNLDAEAGIDITNNALTMGSQNITGVGTNITATAALTVTATGADLTLTGRGAGTTLNEAGDTALVGFTATSIIGALNELAAGSGTAGLWLDNAADYLYPNTVYSDNVAIDSGVMSVGTTPTAAYSISVLNDVNDGSGIYVDMDNTSGNNVGVNIEFSNTGATTSRGVFSTALGATNNYGAHFRATSSSGSPTNNYGIYAEASAADVINRAGWFVATLDSSPGTSVEGVLMTVTSAGSDANARTALSVSLGGTYTGSANTYGIYSTNDIGNRYVYGLYGASTSGNVSATNVGVYGSAASGTANSNQAGRFESSGAAATNYGVYISTTGATTNRGAYVTLSSNSATTSYGYQAVITGTGTTNYGGHFSVTSSSNNTLYGLYIDSYSSLAYGSRTSENYGIYVHRSSIASTSDNEAANVINVDADFNEVASGDTTDWAEGLRVTLTRDQGTWESDTDTGGIIGIIGETYVDGASTEVGDGGYGNVIGTFGYGQVSDGTVTGSVNGTQGQVYVTGGTIGQDLRGAVGYALNEGSAVSRHVIGVYGYALQSSGTLGGNVYGGYFQSFTDQANEETIGVYGVTNDADGTSSVGVVGSVPVDYEHTSGSSSRAIGTLGNVILNTDLTGLTQDQFMVGAHGWAHAGNYDISGDDPSRQLLVGGWFGVGVGTGETGTIDNGMIVGSLNFINDEPGSSLTDLNAYATYSISVEGNSGGTNYGIYSHADNATTNWAGYFVGAVNITDYNNEDVALIHGDTNTFASTVLTLRSDEEDTGSFYFIEAFEDWDTSQDRKFSVDQDGTITSGSSITINGTSGIISSTSTLNVNPGGTMTLGDGGDAITINSNDWDIATNGNMTNIGTITADGAIDFTNASVEIAQYLYHYGDNDTFINYADADDIQIEAGGYDFLHMDGDVAQRIMIGNYTNQDIDFRWDGDTNDNLFYIAANEEEIGIGTNNPSAEMELYKSEAGAVGFQVQNPNAHATAETTIAAQGQSSYLNIGATSEAYAAPWTDAGSIYGGPGNSGGIVMYQDGAYDISFYTNSNEAMEIEGDQEIWMPYVYADDISAKTTRDLYIADDGQLGQIVSSRRYKDNIVDMENTDWLYELRPVNFEYKKAPGQKQYGLIAEEVYEVNPYFTTPDEQGAPETVRYSEFISPLLAAVQEHERRLNELTVGGEGDSPIEGESFVGDLAIDGNLDVSETIKVASVWSQNATWHIDSQGELFVQNVQTQDIEIAEGENKALGNKILPAGQPEVFIENNSVTAQSRIFLTIDEADNLPAGVKVRSKRPNEGFTISTIDGQPASADVSINWLIVN